MNKRRAIRALGLATLILVSTFVGLLVLEVGLRVIFVRGIAWALLTPGSGIMEPHTTRGWTPRADASVFIHALDYIVTSRTNSKGLHDVEHDYANPDDRFRIVVLGDSFLSTDYIDLEDSLPRRLEAALGPGVEVINLGVTGYGTAQEYLYLKEEGLRYEPDLVLVGFFALNDVRNNSFALESRTFGAEDQSAWGRPYASIENGALEFSYPDVARLTASMERNRRAHQHWLDTTPWYRRTMAWGISKHVLGGARNNDERADPYSYLGLYVAEFPEPAHAGGFDYVRHWEEGWRVTSTLFDAMGRLCAAHDARLAVFSIPSKVLVDETQQEFILGRFPEIVYDLSKYDGRAEEIAHDHGFDLIDLLPPFLETRQPHALYHRFDGHWSPYGHRVAARILANWVKAHFDISKDGGRNESVSGAT